MNPLQRWLDSLSLRKRFLVAPLFALALLGTLLAVFVYQAEHQNALLTRIAAREFKSFGLHSDVFVRLSGQHIGLYQLLSNAKETEERTLAEKSKEGLYAIRESTKSVESALAPSAEGADADDALRKALLELIPVYRQAVTSAVEMTSVDPALASKHIGVANDRFIAMSRAFNTLLEVQQQALKSEVDERVRRSHAMTLAFALAGIACAIFALVLSRALSKLLARSLESQIDVLSELGGPDASENNAGANEVERMANAIKMFKKAADRISYLAHYDSLTALPNRTLFHDRLQQAMARAKRSGQMVAVMLLDLDRFKEINDTLGHSAGDEALKKVAGLLEHVIREVDTIARLGGDEFAIIFEEGTHREQITAIAERIRKAFAQPLIVYGREFFVTTSIGIAMHPQHAADDDELLQKADVALYRAKEEGRNTYAIYTPEMNAEADQRLTIDRLLRRAIERNEFVLYYQPKVALDTGEIVGVEALIRWNSEALGLVSPAQFIPLAEETGLIVTIGEWVLRTACMQAKAWQVAGFPPLLMSVNLSPRQFRQKNLANMIEGVLRETGLDARYLELEITEGTVMHDPEKAIAVLVELNRLGVHLSVDDFGTGYSSLSYLKRFPVQTLKIDRSFIQGVTSDPNDVAIVTAIVAMAKSLKLKLLAEGVESEEQREFLIKVQCDEYQGYYFSKPMPPEELARLFEIAAAAA